MSAFLRNIGQTSLAESVSLYTARGRRRIGSKLIRNIGPLRRATVSAGATDPNFANVLLLLHCDGTDGSTTFTDNSSYARTITTNGNAQVDTAQSVFGGASALFDGTGDFLSAPDAAEWAFSNGTIEGRVRFSGSITGRPTLCSQIVDDNNGWALYLDITGAQGLRFVQVEGGGVTINISQGATTGWTADTWYAYAWNKNGNDHVIYRDGTSIASGTDATPIANFAAALQIGWGANTTLGLEGLNGWEDEIRVSDISRYSGNYTIESEAFPNS